MFIYYPDSWTTIVEPGGQQQLSAHYDNLIIIKLIIL